MASIDQSTFRKLQRRYTIALSAIALSVIISQILIHAYLSDQENDSRIINMAGRQRMLSQKLTKETVLLTQANDQEQQDLLHKQLKNTRTLWKESHESLKNIQQNLDLPANSSAVNKMFEEIEPYFDSIYIASAKVIELVPIGSKSDSLQLQLESQKIKRNEGDFLQIMDRIVNQYDIEANAKISRLQNIEVIIMAITLILLFGEFLFIFWPTAKMVKKSMGHLLVAEKQAKKMALDADALSQAKDKSVQELKALSRAMDQTLLFARINTTGYITHMGNKFSKLFRLKSFNLDLKFSEALSNQESEQQYIEKIIEQHIKTGWQGEVKGTTTGGTDIWLEMSLIPFNYGDDKSEMLVICIDITARKKANLKIEEMAQAGFEEKMQQQKTVSRQIIENQEKEQNRIAKDLHDGIGQMLTGLKFNIESIDPQDIEKTTAKVQNLKALTTNIIKGVRTATFNLTPPELTDHGIIPALNKLTEELAKLTGKEIVLFNKTDFNQRLDSLVEINVYRITQEAINNAIKYAESTHIILTLAHSAKILSIIIDDNGKGFNPDEVKKKRNGDGGMGMTFMRERMKYINGRLFVHSEIDKGTRITLNIPI